MSQEETMEIEYIVHCGEPTANGLIYPFKFAAQAPASLCKPHNDKPPDDDEKAPFLTSLITRYHNEILASRPWRCVTCGKRAKELLHSTISFLSPNAEISLPEFKPTVIDTVAPICMSAGTCDRQAEKLIHSVVNNAISCELLKNCDTCGKKSGLKLCSGCKFIAYCSKECQAQSWSSHKKNCRRAQRES